MDRSGTGSYQKRSSTMSQRLRPIDHNVGGFDSVSTASLMEIENRSRAQTPSGSVVGARNRLKDVSNALTTSKELLKIINRIWANADQPSSSMSLVSALHAELERARLQVNQLIHEQRTDQNEISYIMKCFAEEKAAWKTKERQAVETAVDNIAGELEVERKLRRRFESLNKKLGLELAETKASFLKAVKELESERRTREVMEQVCDELARDAGEDKAEAEDLKRDTERVREEVEKEREMLHLADMVHEERAQMKLSGAKHHFQEKHTAVDKLRRQIEAFLGKKRSKEKRSKSRNLGSDEEVAACLSKSQYSSHQDEEKDDGGEVEDAVDGEEDSGESEIHPIELSVNNHSKGYKWAHGSTMGPNFRRISVDDQVKGRNSYSGQIPGRSSSLQRSTSDTVEWGTQGRSVQNRAEGLDRETVMELEKLGQRKSSADESQRYKAVKGLRERLLANARTGSGRDYMSPTREVEQPWSSPRDPYSGIQERASFAQGNGSKSRLGESRVGDSQSSRRSRH
ncbi:OLC1v1034128C2 [Oldenlandia corymbosa var. corymbosa]|nr:OLC1v1034128C2 [Oldenlandia corymbosa var. corymbosa]